MVFFIFIIIFFLCIYKMYLISAEEYKNEEVQFLKVRKAGEIQASMKETGSGMGIKNISDLVSKEMHGILKKTLQKSKLTNDRKSDRKRNLLNVW